MIKTIELSGSQQTVTGLEKNNTLVINNSDAPVYASNKPGILAYADNVIEIPAGARDTVVGTNGTVYVLGLGSGRVELRGVEYVGFKRPSSSIVIDGGGGKKPLERDVICGKFEFVNDGSGIKSVPIEITDTKEKSFAAALAEETGWELQSDGVTVLKDGAGFRFRVGSAYDFVDLVTNSIGSGNIDYFQYLKKHGTKYYMDICTSPSGAVAFGFRLEGEDPNLTFIMTKDGSDDSTCVATYYQNYIIIEWAKKGDTSGRIVRTASRTDGFGDYIVGMFKCIDIYSGGTFEDCYCIYTTPFYSGSNHMFNAGDQIVVEGRRFVIIINETYNKVTQAWLAMPLN